MDALRAYLKVNGWGIQRELGFVDVAGTRKGTRLFPGQRGRTEAPVRT